MVSFSFYPDHIGREEGMEEGIYIYIYVCINFSILDSVTVAFNNKTICKCALYKAYQAVQ